MQALKRVRSSSPETPDKVSLSKQTTRQRYPMPVRLRPSINHTSKNTENIPNPKMRGYMDLDEFVLFLIDEQVVLARLLARLRRLTVHGLA